MSEYMFGTGPGHLPAVAQKIAEKHGADLINSHDAGCNCGYGCAPYTCDKSRRHWFTAPNRGFPFDRDTERAVMADLRAAGVVR